jgi:signal transduction histidine kinase
LKDIYAYGDPKAIGQIFINLITNSIDAIGHNGGRIMIDLINQPYYHNSQEKNGIKVDIIDNGCGIDEAHLKKIFVPYETSKKNKNNVGLGLSIVSKIIEDHNGLIKISSLKGAGTTISIFLPIGSQKSKTIEKEESFLLDDEFFQI